MYADFPGLLLLAGALTTKIILHITCREIQLLDSNQTIAASWPLKAVHCFGFCDNIFWLELDDLQKNTPFIRMLCMSFNGCQEILDLLNKHMQRISTKIRNKTSLRHNLKWTIATERKNETIIEDEENLPVKNKTPVLKPPITIAGKIIPSQDLHTESLGIAVCNYTAKTKDELTLIEGDRLYQMQTGYRNRGSIRLKHAEHVFHR